MAELIVFISTTEETASAAIASGARGKSAYEIWLDAGNTGTEQEYLASLKGEVTQEEFDAHKNDYATLKDEILEEELNLYTSPVLFNDAYWTLYQNPKKLLAGVEYVLNIKANTGFTIDLFMCGTEASLASMVDTIATNITFNVGENILIYKPSVDGLNFFRFQTGNASEVSTFDVYTVSTHLAGFREINSNIGTLETAVGEIEETLIPEHVANYQVSRLNKTISELRELKNSVDDSITSMLDIHSNDGVEKTVTLASRGERERALVRVGLHYGSKIYSNSSTYHDRGEIYFDENCKTNFSDVRFFDSNGKMLKARFGKLANLELSADSRLDNVRKVLSDGTLVRYSEENGIELGANNGDTWTAINGTANVTVNASDGYSRKSMFPVHVDADDNIYAYAGGILYKLHASDGYATKDSVCDFSWVNGSSVTVYPDIQDHGLDIDNDGNVVFGTYAKEIYFHTDIFSSQDGGESFSLVWYNYGGEYQHVHHVHADKFTNKIYVGVDDSGGFRNGSRILVTDDGGITFEEIVIPDVRGKDYFPTYCGDGYRLGGGETFVMGQATIYRSTDDQKLDDVVRGAAGVRSIADFGDDSILICGTQASTYNSENDILVSYDKGKSWDCIATLQHEVYKNSGMGYRQIHSWTTINGDTEPCVIMPKGNGDCPSFRVRKGGWYREAFIELEDLEDEEITIVAKTGYYAKYPYSVIETDEHKGLVYAVPFDEGIGKYVRDSNGNVGIINGSFEWDKNESTRFGDLNSNDLRPFMPHYGVKFDKTAVLSFGQIANLDFNDDFTISLWFKRDHFVGDNFANRDLEGKIFTFGNVYAVYNQQRFAMCKNSFDHRSGMYGLDFYNYTKEYNMLTFTVLEGVCRVYINGEILNNRRDAGSFSIDNNLSTYDFRIDPANTTPFGFMSDFRIYDHAFTDKEALEVYRGW